MKIREAINLFRVFAENLQGTTSDDTTFSDYSIYRQLLPSRATVIRDRIKKDPYAVGEDMYQTIDIELELVDKLDGLPIQSNCYWMKSVKPIPDHIKVREITTLLGNQNIDIVRWDRIDAKINGRIKSAANKRFATFMTKGDDTHLYIANEEKLKLVRETAIYEDPYKASAFNDNRIKCHPLDSDFHTSEYLLDSINKLTASTILQLRGGSRITSDTRNNDALDATSVGQEKP